MPSPDKMQQMMPLMREFGGLERKRLGDGITPLEYQRWLDLKGQMGQKFAKSRGAANGAGDATRPSILLVEWKGRDRLVRSIVPNICPAGIFVATPFAAEIGTRFLLRLCLEAENERAEIPAIVVTSITQGAHTLSTTSMGMSLKFERPSPDQVAALSQLFAGELDVALGIAD